MHEAGPFTYMIQNFRNIPRDVDKIGGDKGIADTHLYQNYPSSLSEGVVPTCLNIFFLCILLGEGIPRKMISSWQFIYHRINEFRTQN